MNDSKFDRMLEIVVTCSEAGLALPLHPRRIAELEEDGFVVDLVTGEVEEIEGRAPLKEEVTLNGD